MQIPIEIEVLIYSNGKLKVTYKDNDAVVVYNNWNELFSDLDTAGELIGEKVLISKVTKED
jgi:hypothetical protein